MKIGIMSMQRVCNYGSFLQSYALMRTIESMGHQVIFVDYKKGRPICRSSREKSSVLKKKLLNLFLSFFEKIRIFDWVLPASAKHALKERRIYKKTILEYLGVSDKKKYHEKVDVLVIGSDEVFNCLQLNPAVGYSEELFGKNSNTSRVVTYAASFGNTTLNKINCFNVAENLKDLISKLSFVSVRDENSFSIIKSLTGKCPMINFDPALIYDFNSGVKNVCNITDFVIVYAYSNRLTDHEIEMIINFADEQNKKIVCIGGYQKIGDVHFVGDAFEILDYFKKADYVFTDTFHGTIMSIINHKRFLTFVRESGTDTYGNAEKLRDLLSRVGLLNQIYCGQENFDFLVKKTIDYASVDDILLAEKHKAYKYLEKCLDLTHE